MHSKPKITFQRSNVNNLSTSLFVTTVADRDYI